MRLSPSAMSLKQKLITGFGVVILLAIVVGGVALLLLEHYNKSTDIIMEANGMEKRLLEARASEKTFLLVNDEQSLEEALEASQSAHKAAVELEDVLTTPEELALLSTVSVSSRQYGQLLAALAKTQKDRNQATHSLGETARIAASRLSTEAQLYMVENTLKRMRARERDFLLRQNNEAVESFNELGQQAIQAIQGSFANQQVKNETSELISAYLATFETAVSSTRQLADVEAQLAETAKKVVGSAAALRTKLNTDMSDYQGHAASLIGIAIMCSVLLGGLTALTLARSIIAPLKEAVGIAEKVAAGDLRDDISVGRQDELGQLQQALATMVKSLRALIRDIGEGSQSIATSTGDLSSVVDQTSQGMNQQRDQTDQVAAAMEEMVAAAGEVARNAEEASTAGSVATEKADIGVKAVDDTLTRIDELNKAVMLAQERLDGLKTETQNIGTILDVIKSVAEQTNLLALNAAIEAARAGEQGRGFAVVADEVRSLAQRTQKSAAEIEALITSLMNSVNQTVDVMKTGTGLTTRTLASARSTGEAIGEMSRTIGNITQLNYQIATAAEEQTSVAEDINRNVTVIRDVTENTAQLTDRSLSASADLARLGDRLRNQVTTFRV